MSYKHVILGMGSSPSDKEVGGDHSNTRGHFKELETIWCDPLEYIRDHYRGHANTLVEARTSIRKMDQSSTWTKPTLPNQAGYFGRGAPSEYGIATMVQGSRKNSGQENNDTEQCQGEFGGTFYVCKCSCSLRLFVNLLQVLIHILNIVDRLVAVVVVAVRSLLHCSTPPSALFQFPPNFLWWPLAALRWS